jgi:protein-S-isoprenylcysteine O-methyltransferase Ste14
MSAVSRLIILAVIWMLWWMPFFLNRVRGQGKAVQIDPRARLGILLVAAGYFIACMHGPGVWNLPVELWRAVAGMAFGAGALALAWMAVGNLGRQWRVDAGLNADHELVQTGAYRVVRHPIYLSMLCMLSMNIAMIGTLPGWPIAILLGIAGTEIRVRVEDSLLRERFGLKFTEWQKRVPAYLPFVR